MKAARAAVAATAVSQTRPARPSDTSIRLPKLQLPTFDGELLQWPDYWDMFQSSVHCQDIPDVTKFNYLKSTLKGAAAKAVAGIAVTGENYLDAVSTLREKFGKKEIIIAALYSKLQHLPAASNKYADIKRTYETMEKILRQLSALDENLDQQRLLIQQLLSKFPLDMTSKLEEWRV